ncbi:MAG: hypothetical protein JSR12_12040 [Bacteroidetes bacterium]|nr:hypothetical protein [Bacteroidota bacterium]
MQKLASILLFVFLFSLFSLKTKAQTVINKIAVFAPLYIDSAFDGSNYKLGNNNLPKNMLPGLEFYNGIMMAIDSLKAEGYSFEVNIYDTKSSIENINNVLQKEEMKGFGLMIASFNNRNEIKTLSNYASVNKIPLISATYPNDGGISNNHYFILLNSTLRMHCKELYKHIQQNYAIGNLVYFTRKGAIENYIQSLFSEMGRTTAAIPLKIKTVELTDSFSTKQITDYLDSNKHNTIICGSLDEAFGIRLIKTINTLKNYRSVLIGMPTWDVLIPDDATVETVYSTPFYYAKNTTLYNSISTKYKQTFNQHATDMLLKGYEAMYYFSHLYFEYGSELMFNHFSENKFKLFNQFNILPNKNTNNNIEYYENNKLYFIKKVGNTIKAVN